MAKSRIKKRALKVYIFWHMCSPGDVCYRGILAAELIVFYVDGVRGSSRNDGAMGGEMPYRTNRVSSLFGILTCKCIPSKVATG